MVSSGRKRRGSERWKNDDLYSSVGEWKPFPKVSQLPLLTLGEQGQKTRNLNHGLSIMKHPNPVRQGVAVGAFLESAGPECMVPGHVRPLIFLGSQLWPIKIKWNFMKTISRELQSMGKFMDVAFDVMNAPFGDR